MKKILLFIVLTPVITLIAYIVFLWASTIHDSVEVGTKYGFTIGGTKQETFADLLDWKKSRPDLVVFTYTEVDGFRHKQYVKVDAQFESLNQYDDWRIHLNGHTRGSNSIRLNFENGMLVYMYRHRQYYELP